MQEYTINIVVLYAENDYTQYSQFLRHLKVLAYSNFISIWDESIAQSINQWKDSVKMAIIEADVVIALISNDFLYSDFYYKELFQLAYNLHLKGKTVVIPVIIRHCFWEVTLIKKINILPENGNPVVDGSWNSVDTALTEVVKGIFDIIKPKDETTKEKPVTTPTNTPIILQETQVSEPDTKLLTEQISSGKQSKPKMINNVYSQVANKIRSVSTIQLFVMPAIAIVMILTIYAAVSANNKLDLQIKQAIDQSVDYREKKIFTGITDLHDRIKPLVELLANNELTNKQKQEIQVVLDEVNLIYLNQLIFDSNKLLSQNHYTKALQNLLNADVEFLSPKHKQQLDKLLTNLIDKFFIQINDSSQFYINQQNYNEAIHTQLTSSIDYLLSIKQLHNYSKSLITIYQQINSLRLSVVISLCNQKVLSGDFSLALNELKNLRDSMPHLTLEQEKMLTDKQNSINELIRLLNNFR